MVSDLLLLPHCDLHLVLQNPPAPLKLSLLDRFDDPNDPKRFSISPISLADCEIEFFAPHAATGHRFDNLPTVNKGTGVVTAPVPGVFLFQIRSGEFYQVARLQVHNRIVSWWFGNDSITTARDPDPTVAHAQPSIYAKFSDDQSGADLVGDVTGHGYVPLKSSDTGKFVVFPNGRLRGVAETTEPANPDDPNDPNRLPTVSGTLGGPPRAIPVRVVDYAKSRNTLFPVQAPTVDQADTQHNVVFLAEGFQQADEALFDIVVRDVASELFDKPRHQPYAMLEGSFNVFTNFLPSVQQSVTTGFRVTDEITAAGPAGLPIPFGRRIEPDNVYTLRELITRVGLPKHNEDRDRDALPGIWAGQNLTDFDPHKVTGRLVDAWKEHRSVGILHARDTVFGLYLGSRLADHPSSFSETVVSKPAQDTPNEKLTAFVARLYEFYDTAPTRHLGLDPRRHALERSVPGFESPGNSLVSYLGGLRYAFTPNQPIGQNWVPENRFKPSRGLVVVIVNDAMIGGTNMNAQTMTALTVNNAFSLPAAYADEAKKEDMRRIPPPTEVQPDIVVDVTAHELGHSFNLGDEYEEFDGDNLEDEEVEDLTHDNLARLEFLRLDQGPRRPIDMARVKWFDLPRMRVSARLVAPSEASLGGLGIRVRINPRHMAHWVEAAKASTEVHLRNRRTNSTGIQLPLVLAEFLTGLSIAAVDEQLGTIDLVGPSIVQPPPVFRAGATVFIPLTGEGGQVLSVVETKVREFLDKTNQPLNADPGHDRRNDDPDQPLHIDGFQPPPRPERLIGIYEGANHWSGGYYRPTGTCKMRDQDAADIHGEFCFVCKWLIVNRVDPGYHSILNAMFYPEAGQNG